MSERLKVIGVKLRERGGWQTEVERTLYVNPAYVDWIRVREDGDGEVHLTRTLPLAVAVVEPDDGWRELLRIMGEPEGTEDT